MSRATSTHVPLQLLEPGSTLHGSDTARATVFSRDADGSTALHIAAQNGRTGILSYLIDSGRLRA